MSCGLGVGHGAVALALAKAGLLSSTMATVYIAVAASTPKINQRAIIGTEIIARQRCTIAPPSVLPEVAVS